ncbi:MAG: RnfABCDGE type electron transport complex subunit G [Oscillospiraceae bacterium]|nr:RnfABCDGE type electron transport complex subunit G [Oscillospiraceae bacterium]
MSGVKNAGPVRLAVTLVLICAIVSLILGFVNHITEDSIRDSLAARSAEAMAEVLEAEYYEPVGDFAPYGTVTALYRAYSGGELLGWVAETSPSGFGGLIDMVVGADGSGAITGVSIVSMSETSGLGANARKESFRSQFIGRSGALALKKNGGEIDALTGATVTSGAVTSGVNDALSVINEYIGRGSGSAEEAPAPPDAVSSATE